ncbi:MAG: hypothetical protein AAJB65_00035 [Candidatus Hodgkinia cicadicola]
MFNGLISSSAIVTAVILLEGGIKIGLILSSASGLKAGDSLACAGVCLTVVCVWQRYVELEAWRVSLSISNLSNVLRFNLINIEQPLKINASLHGHAVSGHVVSAVRLISVCKLGCCLSLWFECPYWLSSSLKAMMSVCLDGTSLTLVNVHGARFSVHLVRYSVRRTSFKSFRRDVEFNFE